MGLSFSVNPVDGCGEDQQQFGKYQDRLLQKSLQPSFLPHSGAQFELQQAVFTACLNALSCCCWLISYFVLASD